MSRLVSSGTGLIFKGSGFYITDYKKANSAPASHSNGKTTTGSDSKPESKSVESTTTESKTVTTEK
jgi:predicted nucleic acid-binding Zn ribbon protein